jgi:hypothetical protein
MINWGLLWTGLGALVVVAIIGMLLCAGDANTSHGVWLVAFLPLAGVLAGAILLAGREA